MMAKGPQEKRCVCASAEKDLSKKKWSTPFLREFEMILDGSMEIGLIYHGNRPFQGSTGTDFLDRFKQ